MQPDGALRCDLARKDDLACGIEDHDIGIGDNGLHRMLRFLSQLMAFLKREVSRNIHAQIHKYLASYIANARP